MSPRQAPLPRAGTGRPHVLLVFDTRYEETAAMLRGIAEHERAHGVWQVFLDDMARAESDMNWVFRHHWDGIISRHTTPRLAKACVERGIALVDLNDTPLFAGVPKIRPDNARIGELGARHLLDTGSRHFAFSGFRTEGWARERRVGFVKALAAAGQPCDVHEVDYPGELTPDWDQQQLTALTAWLRTLPKGTAIMACNDLRALQILGAAHALGLRVPEELAVLGANNDATRCELAQPPLSSVAANPVQAGRQAAERLSRLLTGAAEPQPLDLRIEPAGVAARASTNVLAVADRGVAAAIAYIRDNACRGINVDEVLRHAAMSRAQIEKKFRKHLGRSPQAEIRRVQLQRIQQLLAETELPLKRIAELTGFEYMEYMATLFKRATGHTPGAYRRLHHSSTPPVSLPS